MSMYLKNPIAQVWYLHAPSREDKTRPRLNVNPPSNVPYLNGVADEPTGRRSKTYWFKELDQEYPKQSRRGGRQDLLIHNIPVKNSQPVQYPICQWWEDMKIDDSAEKSPNTYKPQRPSWYEHRDF